MKEKLAAAGGALDELAYNKMTSRENELVTPLHLLATALDPLYGPDVVSNGNDGQLERHRELLDALRSCAEKLNLPYTSVIVQWASYVRKVTTIFCIDYSI